MRALGWAAMKTLRLFKWDQGENVLTGLAGYWILVATTLAVYGSDPTGGLADLRKLELYAKFGGAAVLACFSIFLLQAHCALFAQEARGRRTFLTVLESHLLVGYYLRKRQVTTDGEFKGWVDDYWAWRFAVTEWLKTEEGQFAAASFDAAPTPNRKRIKWDAAYGGGDHLRTLQELFENCEVLEALRKRVSSVGVG